MNQKFETVTYGTASASFIAIGCLHQLAVDASLQYSLGSQKIFRDCYVDDLLTGADTKEEVHRFKSEIISILTKSGFNL